MSGILTPIAGEAKKRTCYFFDSGEWLSSLCGPPTCPSCVVRVPRRAMSSSLPPLSPTSDEDGRSGARRCDQVTDLSLAHTDIGNYRELAACPPACPVG